MPALKNTKHEQFVRLVLKGVPAVDAYEQVGYTAKTANALAACASRLLNDAKIQLRLQELQSQVTSKAVEKAAITKAAVLEELAKIGFANMLDYIQTQPDGYAYVDLSKLTRDQAAAIQEVVVEEYKEGRGEDARDVKRVKFKLADKKGALVDIGKHLGMFIDRQEVGKPGDFSNMTDEEIVNEIERLNEAEIANMHDGNGTVN